VINLPRVVSRTAAVESQPEPAVERWEWAESSPPPRAEGAVEAEALDVRRGGDFPALPEERVVLQLPVRGLRLLQRQHGWDSSLGTTSHASL